jgi:hypothetical protein
VVRGRHWIGVGGADEADGGSHQSEEETGHGCTPVSGFFFYCRSEPGELFIPIGNPLRPFTLINESGLRNTTAKLENLSYCWKSGDFPLRSDGKNASF